MIASLATSAPNQFLDIGGTRFAYRRFGTPSGTALVFTRHFMGDRAAARGWASAPADRTERTAPRSGTD